MTNEVAAAEATRAAKSRGRSRSVGAGILGFLAVLAIVLATQVGAIHFVVLSPDRLAAIATPIGANPQVQAVVASRAATEIVDALGVEARAEAALGSKLGPIMAPVIAQGVTDRLTTAFEKALTSEAVASRWDDIVRVATGSLIAVLRGDTQAVTTIDGTVYLNLLPFATDTLAALQRQGLIDASVQLPDLSNAADEPGAIGRLATVLGTKLPPTFGQVPLADTNGLLKAQSAVAAFDDLAVALIVVALLLSVIAVLAARDRLRAIVLIGLVSGLIVAVIPPLLHQGDRILVGNLAASNAQVIATAFTDSVIDAISWPLRWVALGCLGVALIGLTVAPPRFLVLGVGAAVFVVGWVVIGTGAALLGLAVVDIAAYATRGRTPDAPPSDAAPGAVAAPDAPADATASPAA